MWLLIVLLLADTSRAFSIALAPAESVWVTVEGVGDPVVLIPGLFGSAFGYRTVLPRLVEAGYRTIVIEPLGIGTACRPEHADYSLTAPADRVAAAPRGDPLPGAPRRGHRRPRVRREPAGGGHARGTAPLIRGGHRARRGPLRL